MLKEMSDAVRHFNRFHSALRDKMVVNRTVFSSKSCKSLRKSFFWQNINVQPIIQLLVEKRFFQLFKFDFMHLFHPPCLIRNKSFPKTVPEQQRQCRLW